MNEATLTSPTVVEPAKLSEPAAAPSSDTHFVRRDAFEVAEVKVLTVRREGALFAASSKAALPTQRPRGACRVLRTHWQPRDENAGPAWDEYAVELVATGMPAILLNEKVMESFAFDGPETSVAVPTTRPTIVSTETVIGNVRLIENVDEPDVLVVRSEFGVARFDRVSVKATLRAARTMIDDLRRNSKPAG